MDISEPNTKRISQGIIEKSIDEGRRRVKIAGAFDSISGD